MAIFWAVAAMRIRLLTFERFEPTVSARPSTTTCGVYT